MQLTQTMMYTKVSSGNTQGLHGLIRVIVGRKSVPRKCFMRVENANFLRRAKHPGTEHLFL